MDKNHFNIKIFWYSRPTYYKLIFRAQLQRHGSLLAFLLNDVSFIIYYFQLDPGLWWLGEWMIRSSLGNSDRICSGFAVILSSYQIFGLPLCLQPSIFLIKMFLFLTIWPKYASNSSAILVASNRFDFFQNLFVRPSGYLWYCENILLQHHIPNLSTCLVSLSSSSYFHIRTQNMVASDFLFILF